MVVGIAQSLECGRTYSRGDLRERFPVDAANLDYLINRLVERGRLRPTTIARGSVIGYDASGRPLSHVRCIRDERAMRFEAL